MKLSYVHGPGDAFGTFQYWSAGHEDKNIIKQTYSGQFFDLVKELGAKGQVVCVRDCGASENPSYTFEQVDRKKAGGWRHYREELRYAKAVATKVSTFSPDIIIVSSDFPPYFWNILPKGPTKILSMHNTFWTPFGRPEGLKETALDVLTRRAIRNADFAVCVSRECQRQFDHIRNDPSVFSAVQIPRIKHHPRPTAPTHAEKLLYVGRVEENKGITDLIRAYAKVRETFPALSLTIVGHGTALETCKTLAVQLVGEDGISFKGRLDAAGVQAAYQAADLCICTTRNDFFEGLATVPIEAAAHGIPSIISSAVPAREYFSHAGVCFEAGNIDDLTDKITAFVAAPETYQAAVADANSSYAAVMADVGDWISGMRTCISKSGLAP